MAFYTNNNPNAVKKTTQEIVGPMPAEKTTPAPTYTPAIQSLGEKISGKPTNTAYVPGGSIDSAKTGLVNAQNQSKVNELADTAAKYGIGQRAQNAQSIPNIAVQRTNNPANIDIAEQLGYVMQQPITYENQQKVADLLRQRNFKIAQNPEYSQYANDPIQKAAEAYLSQIAIPEINTQNYLNKMIANNDNYYQLHSQNLANQLEYQREATSQQYDDLRKAALINAARKALGNEEVLAAQGLGRGASNAASSGFGESSRMMAQTSLNNNLANAYLAEQQALQELQNQHNNNFTNLTSNYLDRTTNVDLAALEQANVDADRALNVAGMNISNNQWNKQFNRGVFESDRDYNRGVYVDDRNYNRNAYVDDRNYDRGVLESDRDYNRGVYVDDRNFAEGVRQFNEGNALDWYNATHKKTSGSSSGGIVYDFRDGRTPKYEPSFEDNKVLNSYEEDVYNKLASGATKYEVLDYIRGLQDEFGLSPGIADAMIIKYNLLG